MIFIVDIDFFYKGHKINIIISQTIYTRHFVLLIRTFRGKVCNIKKNNVSLHPQLSPDGGIGRRAGLKHQ